MENDALTDIARALYDAAESIENPLKLIAIAVLISLIIWFPYALRIYFLGQSLGYIVPLYLIFFLQPLVSLLTAIPVTIAGLGLAETGMALLMVSLGLPAPPRNIDSSSRIDIPPTKFLATSYQAYDDACSANI